MFNSSFHILANFFLALELVYPLLSAAVLVQVPDPGGSGKIPGGSGNSQRFCKTRRFREIFQRFRVLTEKLLEKFEIVL